MEALNLIPTHKMEILEMAQIRKDITMVIEYALDTCHNEEEEEEAGKFLIENGFDSFFINNLITKRQMKKLFK